MKLFPFVALLGAVQGSNPIRRVVDLLVGLKEKCENDLKAEEDLFESYECWYKNIVNGKGASNDAAQSRIDSLTSYIEDIDAGRIEFTTERKDLEKQVKGLKSDLEKAKAIRDQEKSDYEAADEEMGTAIKALDEAIAVLEDGKSETDFLQAEDHRGLNLRWNLRKAIQVGRAFLSKSDAKYLEAMLDKPDPDWKKLNRKATFKMKYKARSGKIIQTLKSMKDTFEKNKEEAAVKEGNSEDEYQELKSAKEGMLSAAEGALTDMAKEGAARGLSKDDAQQEIDALSDQITADEKYISETEAAYKVKAEEWKARKELRSNEILAFGKALEIIHSDDARDAFKKSFNSQGYSFLQVSEHSQCQAIRKNRAQALRQLATAVHDPRVSLLALVADVSGIDKVIESIDKLVATLKEEEGEDLTNKEQCEKDLADNYQQARMSALKIDTLTEDGDRAKAKIEQIDDQIKEREESVEELKAQLKSAEDQRAEENRRFEADKVDDEKAIELIKMASAVLKKWKTGGDFAQLRQDSFLQIRSRKQVPAGEAPLPPPATWETGAEYGGAEGETKGIMAIMQLIQDDVQKDIDLAAQGEADAVKSFEAIKADLETTIADGEKAIETYRSEKADQESALNDAVTERATEKEGLDGTMKEIASLKPGCNFILINFDVRTKKRQVEIDGLKKAKAILQGADYGKGGASFVQSDGTRQLC